jgi:hypothetical protein
VVSTVWNYKNILILHSQISMKNDPKLGDWYRLLAYKRQQACRKFM